jgi:hypothetical protein
MLARNPPGALIHKRQRPPCPTTSTGLLDVDWIPQVAARGSHSVRVGPLRTTQHPVALSVAAPVNWPIYQRA